MWGLRALKSRAPVSYSTLRGWFLAARLARVQRLLRKARRARKHLKVEAILSEAAASPHASAIFSAIKRLAPKSRFQRVQLRNSQGCLMSPAEEAAHIAEFFRDVYCSQGIYSPPDPAPINGITFTLPELEQAMRHLHPAKALPSSFVPARLWREASAHIAPLLLPAVNLEQASLPGAWHKVQVCTIPKTPTVRLPKQLRPISLLHPANKILASMIAQRVLPKITAYLQHVPQWAYLPGRSTGDALEAVCSHLAQARTLARNSSASLLQRFEGHIPLLISGGISVSLDIHKAFDSLPHTFLTQAMNDASFDPCEIDLILHLHHQAVLCFGVGSECSSTSQVVMGSGIRQGCSLSPLLWSLITGLIYRQFQTALALQNLPEGTTTLFADDVFGSWLFQTPTTFRKAIRAVGVLIDVIQKAGLKLSMDKTVILLLAQGTSAPSILSGIRRFIDKIPHLLVPIGRVRTPLKLVQEHKYLGALLSYHNFELTNLRHRLSVMWGAYWRLQHILRSGALGLSMRTAIWRICVFSVLRYSLCHVGIPTGGHNLIRQAVHRQLRLIAKSPACDLCADT